MNIPNSTGKFTQDQTIKLGQGNKIINVSVIVFEKLIFQNVEKAVETLACGSCPQAFLVLPNFHLCFYNSIETRYTFFYFLSRT